MELRDAIVHSAPADIADWPETIRIVGVHVRPGESGGFSLEFDTYPPDSWDYHMPGWGDLDKGGTDPGNVRYTVWAVIEIDGQLHAAGFIQMWKGRTSTGAPPLSGWQNWAYDTGRWGKRMHKHRHPATVMVNYQPKPGDQFGLLVSAGNARGESGVTSVRERSNMVVFPLPEGDMGDFGFSQPTNADYAGMVAEIKSGLEQRGVDLSGPCGAFQITKRVAWALRPDYGLVAKPTGNNCEGYSVDGIMDRAGNFYDVLVGSGDTNGPSWQPNGTVAADRFRDAPDPGDTPVDPPAPPPPPPPPVPDTPPESDGAIGAKLDILAAAVVQMRDNVNVMTEEVRGLRRDVLNAGATLAKLIPLLGGGLGNLFGTGSKPDDDSTQG
jgi:hypothetical protein